MNLDKLDENRVEMALMKLADTNETHAQLSGQVDYLTEAVKQAKAHSFLLADGGVAEREQKAQASDKVADAVKERTKAYVQFKTLDNERNHEIRIIDIWRTLSSNRRQGGI